MNKFKKILLSILGGVDVVFYIATPILLVVIWLAIFGLENFGEKILFSLGLLSTLFRAIKIGWLKE